MLAARDLVDPGLTATQVRRLTEAADYLTVAPGVVRVVREAYPDPTDGTGRWVCTDMQTVAPLPRKVSLAEIKAEPALADLALVRMSRLSVMPVSPAHWAILCRMGGWNGS